MTTYIHHQDLPAAGPAREALREKGQFWTPDWVAEAMVAYTTTDGDGTVFDPAVGAGAFFRAAKNMARETGNCLRLMGTEIDPSALLEARQHGLTDDDLGDVQITDFLFQPPKRHFRAIVANPPYIRHHRLTREVKLALQAYGADLIGARLDGRAGYHVYFLLRALQLLELGGRLAFIMPADTCEGIFAATLWRWIASRYRLDAVVTFTPEATPFPRVDTNAVVFMIRNAPPVSRFSWARCTEAHQPHLRAWALSGLTAPPGASLLVHDRDLVEGVSTGLSRPPQDGPHTGHTLADFARVVRGIATGANDFFFLTTERAASLGLPGEFLLPAIGRTRDVLSDVIDDGIVAQLAASGRPTLLFSPDGRPLDQFPAPVRAYLEQGQAAGIDRQTLIATRRPWYKMEVRTPPPFLFAYLGRRNARFIRNIAGVLPLTGFLCVYAKRQDAEAMAALWSVLQHPETVANLALVGKSYGAGAIKVEPRALDRLPLPEAVVEAAGLTPAAKAEQLALAIAD